MVLDALAVVSKLFGLQRWKVTKYIYSTCTLLEYFPLMPLYTSTPLQFTGKYCTFYSSIFIWQLVKLVTIVTLQIKGSIWYIFNVINHKMTMIWHQTLRTHAELKYWLLRQQCYSQYILLWNLHSGPERLFLFWSVWYRPLTSSTPRCHIWNKLAYKQPSAVMEARKQTRSTEITLNIRFYPTWKASAHLSVVREQLSYQGSKYLRHTAGELIQTTAAGQRLTPSCPEGIPQIAKMCDNQSHQRSGRAIGPVFWIWTAVPI